MIGIPELVADIYFGYRDIDPLAHAAVRAHATAFVSLVDRTVRELETPSERPSVFDSHPVLTESIRP